MAKKTKGINLKEAAKGMAVALMMLFAVSLGMGFVMFFAGLGANFAQPKLDCYYKTQLLTDDANTVFVQTRDVPCKG